MRTLIMIEQGAEMVKCPVCGDMVELTEEGENLIVTAGCIHLQGCEVELVDGKWEILVPMFNEEG